MSYLCTMPGIDLSSPITLKSGIHEGTIFLPEELSVFNDPSLMYSDWWVIPAYGRFTNRLINQQKPLLYICTTCAHEFRIDFFWHSHRKILRKLKFEIIGYKRIIIFPSAPISLDDLTKFLFSTEKEAWIFLAERCRLNTISKKRINEAFQYFGVDNEQK